jgi:uncharacterized iron-regulated membrane protein
MQVNLGRFFTRSFWLKIHLYLALIAGFFFVLIGLSGSLSVYRDELDSLLNPKLYVENPQGKFQSLDKIIASVKAAHPERHGSWTLEMPRTPHDMMTAWFEKPQETYFELYAPLMVSVNPYTAEVVSSRLWGQTAMTWLLDLHTQLRLDRLGWQMVGVLGGLLMLSVASGLYLWWPAKGRFKQALQIRLHGGVLQLTFDLHRWCGLLFAPALLILAFTGLQLSYPGILESLLSTPDMGHGNNGKNVTSTARPNNHPVPLEAAEFIARGPFPQATLRRVTTPVGETGTYRINLRQSDEINAKHPFTMVWIDRWSGHIKEVRNPNQFSWDEKLMSSLWPVHTGEALGSAGRFLWFLTGLAPLFLYVTGLLHWLHKSGKIQDRPIDYAAMQRRLLRWQATCQRTAGKIFEAVLLFIKLTRPYLKSAWEKAAYYLEQFHKR